MPSSQESMNSFDPPLENDHLWYEGPDGTCNLLTPTLLNLGDDKPLHLLFPVHWHESLAVLPSVKQLASEHDAFLVLMLHGEASDHEIQALVIGLADAQVLPLWLGEQNRKKFDRIVEMFSRQTPN